MNISPGTLDLRGVAFTLGVTYTFASGVTLAPGERIVVVKNAAESFSGSSPTVAGSQPVALAIIDPTVVNSAGLPYFVFTCTRSGESGDGSYYVEFSTDLQSWQQNGVLAGSVTNADGTITRRWRSAQPMDGSVPALYARQRARFK